MSPDSLSAAAQHEHPRVLLAAEQAAERFELHDVLETRGYAVTTAATFGELQQGIAEGSHCALILTGAMAERWPQASAHLPTGKAPARFTVIAVLSTDAAERSGRIPGVDHHVVQSSPQWQNDLVEALRPTPAPQTACQPDDSSARSGLDIAELRATLDDIGFDEDGIIEVVGLFLADTPSTLASLEEAASNGNTDQIASGAHALKSPAALLGAHGLSAMASRMEQDGRAGECPDAVSRAAAVREEFLAVRATLEHEFPQLVS